MELQLQLDGYNVSIHKTESMIKAEKTSIESTERKSDFAQKT